ncbi:hypothetical protein L6164_037086 [Bauhinia variegata]|uniref:Uncharacterized protein n=1 Tax=Bauhinia variegata TaxID=167791 RepID=A0ACB9KJ40_BAUVA|nr:hypothetical protein L6164_037086 [Bauhinia variegata]
MATLPFFLLLFIFLLILPCTTCNPVCDSYLTCGAESPDIHFPFWIRDWNPDQRCGYPGFELSCDNGRTLLNIPNGGNFVVKDLSSVDVSIDDTDGCLPKRFLEQNVNLTGTPFKWGKDYNLVNLTFFKCSNLLDGNPLEFVPCLSSSYKSDVFVLFPTKSYENEWIASCELISSTWIPMSSSRPWYLPWEIELTWSEPDCGKCNPYSELCGFLEDTGPNVTCYPRYTSPSNGANRDPESGATIGKALAISLLVLICFAVVRPLVCGKSKSGIHRQQSQASVALPTSIALQPQPQPPIVEVAITAVGLDKSIIETYPKIEVIESGTLPDPNDKVCSI